MTELRAFVVTVRVAANNASAAGHIMDICRRSGYFEEVVCILDPEQCTLCSGSGLSKIEDCNCGGGASSYINDHDPYCGYDPCPNGCPVPKEKS